MSAYAGLMSAMCFQSTQKEKVCVEGGRREGERGEREKRGGAGGVGEEKGREEKERKENRMRQNKCSNHNLQL